MKLSFIWQCGLSWVTSQRTEYTVWQENVCVWLNAGQTSHEVTLSFNSYFILQVKDKHEGLTHLCQFWRLDLFYLKKIADGQEGDGHSADADHKNDQRWTVVDVASQVLYRV